MIICQNQLKISLQWGIFFFSFMYIEKAKALNVQFQSNLIQSITIPGNDNINSKREGNGKCKKRT